MYQQQEQQSGNPFTGAGLGFALGGIAALQGSGIAERYYNEYDPYNKVQDRVREVWKNAPEGSPSEKRVDAMRQKIRDKKEQTKKVASLVYALGLPLTSALIGGMITGTDNN